MGKTLLYFVLDLQQRVSGNRDTARKRHADPPIRRHNLIGNGGSAAASGCPAGNGCPTGRWRHTKYTSASSLQIFTETVSPMPILGGGGLP